VRPRAANLPNPTTDDLPRALLVGVALDGKAIQLADLDELDALVGSAQLQVGGKLICRRQRPDAALYVGTGKAEEIKAMVEEQALDLVVFDDPISPIQQRNLTRLIGVPVLDRVELILDIFAQRARSNEGKLQVELARIEHQITRLVRSWSHLERQRGGFGQRGGPGEKQIELDRRMLDGKAKQLKQRLTKLERQRNTRRRARGRNPIPLIALVGYTNAGKSSLFNALTHAQTYAADQLFATLDTLSRQLYLGPHEQVVISDTVGFVRNLPHSLVQAFKATLEETAQADLLVHVVDAANPAFREQIAEVQKVLATIGAGEVLQLLVFNKIDLLPEGVAHAPGEPLISQQQTSSTDPMDTPPCDRLPRFWVSAHSGAGLSELRQFLRQFAGQYALKASRQDADAQHPDVSGPSLVLPSSEKVQHDAFVA
jgi:GTPase